MCRNVITYTAWSPLLNPVSWASSKALNSGESDSRLPAFFILWPQGRQGREAVMSNKISVVINTYNAETFLREVLESVKDFDEVVICDMESTDHTLSIAREYGCKIVTFPKGNISICEPARDFAIHSASNRWVLVVDADEIVPDALRKYLYEQIAEPGFCNAIDIPRANMFMGKRRTGTPDRQLRFFRQDRAVWPPVIHSAPKLEDPVISIPANRKDLYLIHLEDFSIAKRIDKLNCYSDYEVIRKPHRKYGFLGMIFRPLCFFLASFVFQRGFCDGKRGLFRGYFAAFYQVMYMAKLYEIRLKSENKN